MKDDLTGGNPGMNRRELGWSLKLEVIWLCRVGKYRMAARVEAQELK